MAQKKPIYVLDSNEPWSLDHEEVIQSLDVMTGGDNNPVYEGVNGPGLAVRVPGGASLRSTPKQGEGSGGLACPPGEKIFSGVTGTQHFRNVQNHSQGGSSFLPKEPHRDLAAGKRSRDDVTRVEVTTGRGSGRFSTPPEHGNNYLGLQQHKLQQSDTNNNENIITIEDIHGRDRNYVSHTIQPNLQFSVQNNVQDMEDRATIEAYLKQVGFLTEQVGNLQKDNTAFRVALQQANLNVAADSGRNFTYHGPVQSDPFSLPGGSGLCGKKTARDHTNPPLPSHSENPVMYSGADYGGEPQSHHYRYTSDSREEASIHGESRNISRYGLGLIFITNHN